jgi:hypothetical protein
LSSFSRRRPSRRCHVRGESYRFSGSAGERFSRYWVRYSRLNAAQNQITVNVSFSGLSAPATAGHIHGPAAPGSNAPVLFPFAGVPNATSGNIPEQTFAITPTQVAQLFGGLFYVNIHSSNFPGGEIRGQLVQTPEPATLTLLMTGIAGVGTVVRKRRKAA